MKDLLYPLLIKIMKKQRKVELEILNEKPRIEGNAIYAINHSCVYDMPFAAEIIGEHTYVLAGKQRLEIVDWLAFTVNGVIWVDRSDKKHRAKAKEKIEHLLNKGRNVSMFPEALWNLTPSKPMLPLWWGCIDIAKETKKPIVPLILEFREKECIVKWGEPMYIVPSDDKKVKIQELRDGMATLKWEIWESFPVERRADIEEKEWEREKKARIAAYPKADYEYEKQFMRKD